MRSILLVLTIALGLVACHGNSSTTTPTVAAPKVPVPHGPVTAEAMTAYFQLRFPAQVADGSLLLAFGSDGVAEDIAKELRLLGIDDMSGVAALVPADFDTKGFGAIKASEAPTTNVAGLMRDLMIIHDTRGYFTRAWNNGWVSSGPQDFPAPAAYGVDFGVMEELGAFGSGDGDGGEDWEGGDDEGAGDPCGE